MKDLDPRLEGRICCPECGGELAARGAFLDCVRCALAFPLIDGVPYLLKARSKRLPKAGKR
jgi:uncharacterized protein YbaR (Trm112 family)